MQTDIVTILLGFVEGIGLIISPCILPILPIILSGSLSGSRGRPLGITVGFVLVFALFTFFSRALVQALGVDLDWIRHISYVILILLGVMMISTDLTERFALLTQRLANVGAGLKTVNNPNSGFIGGLLFGGIVALIWTPCAGPIFAAIIVQTVLQKSDFISFLTILAFGMGAAIPMFLIALFGRTAINKVGFLKTHTVLLRKILGVVIIAAVVYMIYSENSSIATTTISGANVQQDQLINGLEHPYAAPMFSDLDQWLNSKPLQINQLKGKVVLVDFWTYSCINCIRTLPYLKAWYQKYHAKGLVIIGVHAPEFEFEKDIGNVSAAVKRYGIVYPVQLDNQLGTWANYNNQYWPAHYLIDQNGQVVYEHFGEGEYAVTENNIRYLLGLNKIRMAKTPEETASITNLTPETYLGTARADRNKSPEEVMAGQPATYSFPDELLQNEWALQGDWVINTDDIVSYAKNAALKIHFNAAKVYAVMGGANGHPVSVSVVLNGQVKKTMTVDKHMLYQLVDLKKPMSGMLQLTADGAGLEVYTFTFGD